MVDAPIKHLQVIIDNYVLILNKNRSTNYLIYAILYYRKEVGNGKEK